jgi:hypothetical protein
MKANEPEGVSSHRLALAAAVLCCVGFLGACGSSKSTQGSTTRAATTLDTRRVALAIEQSILSERHIRSHVTCPTAVPQRAGRIFVCIATVGSVKHHTTSTPFVVKVQNDKGYVTYQAK